MKIPPALTHFLSDLSSFGAKNRLPAEPPKPCLLLREVKSVYVAVASRIVGVPCVVDCRALLKYVSPHLALQGINLYVGSAMLGHIFRLPPGVAAKSRASELKIEKRVLWGCGATFLSCKDEQNLSRVVSNGFRERRADFESEHWAQPKRLLEIKSTAFPAAL